MIVNYREKGWEVVTQRAHGLLAAQIALHWRHKDRGVRWLELLLAIAEHDDANVELEKDDLLTCTGGPLDFKMVRFDAVHCQRTMSFALSKSRYIALICSMHLTFVYKQFQDDDPQAAAFIKEQRVLQKMWKKALNISAGEIKRDYQLLEWCDALSLLLCQHDEQPEARMVEVSAGPDGRNYLLKKCDDGNLTVLPWPFEASHFELRFERRLIPQLTFEDTADFRKSFHQAEVSEVIRKFVRRN